MTRPTMYGTVEFYSDMFGDLLADVQSDDPSTTENIIQGFLSSTRLMVRVSR